MCGGVSHLSSLKHLTAALQDITRLQANVAATKAAKVVLEQELIECERQIMLLERKLELEKETQAACACPPLPTTPLPRTNSLL